MTDDYAKWLYSRLRTIEGIPEDQRTPQDVSELDSISEELRGRFPGAF